MPLDHGTVYLFVQWTHRELHSDFRRAEPTSSCWTMSPIDQSSGGWNRTNVLLVQSQESHTSSDSPGIWNVNSLYRLRPSSSLFARRAQLLYQQQLPRSVCFQFGEEGSNLRLLIQSQEAYR